MEHGGSSPHPASAVSPGSVYTALRLGACLLAMFPLPALAQSVAPQAASAGHASIDEELKWLEAESVVYSASRHEQKVSQTAAAVYVITAEDIRRSGVTSIPEALRMVPGLDVARVNANVWAISSRGFNGIAANKLLVMIDGRTVYNPIISGTLWRAKDVMLEDVKRIEVIRGPGASMWGANAVNGVINIITKSSKDTQGTLVTAGGGNEVQGAGALRYGGKLGANTYYRGYVKYTRRNRSALASGGDPRDNWANAQGGFRIDSNPTSLDSTTLQGDIYSGRANALENIVAPISPYSTATDVGDDYDGGNILGRWKHTYSDTSDMTLQLYYDEAKNATRYTSYANTLSSIVRTYDLDFQHHFQPFSGHNLIWGVGLRYISDHIHNAVNFAFSPTARVYRRYSAFAQDEIMLTGHLRFIVGSKLSHNDFSGTEVQPNARIAWAPDKRHTLWAAVSRAVRTPNRLDQDVSALYLSRISPGVYAVGKGNKGMDSEKLIAYEIGYRTQPSTDVALDMTAFYNHYTKLVTSSAGTAFLQATPTAHVVVPITGSNSMHGHTYGAELSAQWKARDWWRLKASYSWLRIQLRAEPASVAAENAEGYSPKHQASLQSSMDLPRNTELDTWLRYVDKLPAAQINSYVTMDIRLGWKPTKHLELSLTGKNLLDKNHPEFLDPSLGHPLAVVQRSVFAKATWRY